MRDRLKKCSVLILLALLSLDLRGQTPRDQAIQQHYARATEAERAGKNDIAVQEFRQVLQLDSHNAEAHANLGVIAYAEKDYTQAADEFRAALKLRPTLWNAEAFLGMSELRLGHPQPAKMALEESFWHVDDPKLRSQAGSDLISLYYQNHELLQILDVLQVLERASTNAPNLLYTAYRTYTELAAQTLATLLRVAPDSAEMHQILAQTAESQDDFAAAIAQYRRALEISPRLAGLHFELGQVILASSKDEPARREAEKEFRLALADDPADANSHYLLGEIAWLRSKPEVALEEYQEAVRLQPGFVDARIALGRALTTLGRAQEAIQEEAEAVRLDPQNEAAHYRLAQTYRKLGRAEEAEHELATLQKIRDSRASNADALRQIQGDRLLLHQGVAPNEPQ